jgi:aryl-alcohol dehydrogenase-like predicted oxidoreductase
VTPAQVALAWLLRRSLAVVVIPGTANPGHLRANIAAGEVAGDLTDLVTGWCAAWHAPREV